MIVALPVCHKDKALALQNLEWCLSMEPNGVPFAAVITTDTDQHVSEVEVSAKQYFQKGIHTHYYEPWRGAQAWPAPENWAWSRTTKLIAQYKEPWLWWEQDAVPLRPDWLKTLADEYAKAKQPFMGHWVANNNGHAYMNGVGIYPPDVVRYDTQSIMVREHGNFDIVLGPSIARICHHANHLMAHSLTPVIFNTLEDLAILPETAVMFHHCKDASLIRVLRNGKKKTFISPLTDLIKDITGFRKAEVIHEQSFTVVITNWKRPEQVQVAFDSCIQAGVKNVIVSASAVDRQLASVHEGFRRRKPDVVIDAIDEDRGCNEMWLRGVKLVKTPWVNILHDDDKLLPDFGKLELKEDVGFYHWNGGKHWGQEDHTRYKNLEGQIYDSFPGRPTGIYSTDEFWNILLNPHTNSISPVAGMFRTRDAVDILTECEKALIHERYHYRPTMMVGNDLMLWLRNVGKYPRFKFFHEPKISYGHWQGSCSFEDLGKTGQKKLKDIYNAVRDYYYRGPDISKSAPLMAHVFSLYPAAGKRESDAMSQWWPQYAQGKWTVCPVVDRELPRLFNDGGRRVPYLKDLINQAWRTNAEVCVLTNLDIIPIESLTRHLSNAFNSHKACYSYRRDIDQFRILDGFSIRTQTMPYAGMDLFAFTRHWWDEYGSELPDLLYATEAWDYCLKVLMDAHGGKPFYYLIYHVFHEAEVLRNKDSASQKHNRKLASEFLRRYNIVPYWDTGLKAENPR